MSVWIEVFVLTIIECMSPPGKTVCERSEPLELRFIDSIECRSAVDSVILEFMAKENSILVEEPICKARAEYVVGMETEDEMNERIETYPDLFDNTGSYLWEIYKGGKY